MVLLVLALAGSAFAKDAAPLADDPVLQARVIRIAEELRCLVCQNETIAASNADLAVDLRNQIRVQIGQGRSDAEIRDFMVQRYGDFVLYRPPLKSSTLALWVGPFVLLLVAGTVLLRQIRRRRALIAARPLTPAEAERARRLLGEENSPAS
nr:cytochrome c-type biogenesis protein [uncultured Methylibium sp.]